MNIETKTINDLRTFNLSPTPPNSGDYYYITDSGKEGEWYYDGTDNTTIDNLGTVVTSPFNPLPGANRMVFKRRSPRPSVSGKIVPLLLHLRISVPASS